MVSGHASNFKLANMARAVAIVAMACLESRVEAAEVDQVRGSTNGVTTADPQWGVGLQLGSEYAAAQAVLTFQRVGMYDGALNLGIGTWLGGFAVSADYLYMFDENMNYKPLSDTVTYNQLRGTMMPYAGFGASAGYGLAARLPFGVQYTMLRDPFTFFGGGALVIGSVRKDRDDDLKVRGGVGLNIGARMLL